jgi:magnesium transporter
MSEHTPVPSLRDTTVFTPELLYLLAGDPVEFAEAVAGLRSVDLAESLRDLRPEAAAVVLCALPFDAAVAVFNEPELDNRHEILRQIDDATAAQLIDAMSPDQQADVFRALSEEERARYLKHLGAPTRDRLTLLLRYPPDTAGGLMTTEFVTVPADWTVEQALQHIHNVGEAKETVYAVYVHDPADRRLVHVVSLRELVVADPATPVGHVGEPRPPITVGPRTDREEVARIISKYDLLAVPVVDAGGHVIGIVTVDDVIDAIVSEQTEDVHKFGGMEALDAPYTEIGLGGMIKKRAGWLCALFLAEMLTASAMGHFEQEIARAVVLALFIPLIISSGGNSGSQATSLIIRAMALREVTLRDWGRVALRELPSGLVLGAILGSISIARILAWQALGLHDYGSHHGLIAATVGLALVGVVTFGSLTGSMLPFVLRRLGFDPASASAPFVATLVDVTGIVIYFTIAALILRGTLL